MGSTLPFCKVVRILITGVAVILLLGSALVRGEYCYSDQRSWGGNCNNGRSQSPINIQPLKTVLDGSLGNLKADYRKCTNALPTFTNAGHNLEVTGDAPFGTLTIENLTYNFTGFHFHSPSEHTISGRRSDLELHLVHVANTDSGPKIAVVGILYDKWPTSLVSSDPFLSQVFKVIPSVPTAGSSVTWKKSLDLSRVECYLKSQTYARYMGSKTNPPCVEGVTWTVFQTPRVMSQAQFETYRTVFKDSSSRNVQPRNDRIVRRNLPGPVVCLI